MCLRGKGRQGTARGLRPTRKGSKNVPCWRTSLPRCVVRPVAKGAGACCTVGVPKRNANDGSRASVACAPRPGNKRFVARESPDHQHLPKDNSLPCHQVPAHLAEAWVVAAHSRPSTVAASSTHPSIGVAFTPTGASFWRLFRSSNRRLRAVLAAAMLSGEGQSRLRNSACCVASKQGSAAGHTLGEPGGSCRTQL